MASVHQTWSTDSFEARQRYEAWDEALCRLYGRWASARQPDTSFSASAEHRSLQNFSVIECICDPCAASRGRSEMRSDEPDFLALQLVLAGEEQIRFGGEEYSLAAGDIFVWDSTQPMDFRVTRRLHKISVKLPLTRFRRWLPDTWQGIRRQLKPESAAGSLLAGYMESLSPIRQADGFNQCDALIETTIGLLVNSLDLGARGTPQSHRDVHFARVRRYIGEHLTEPDLSPARIAGANRISVRYLHWLFEGTGSSVRQFIIRERLNRCRRDLENPLIPTRKLIDVAIACGFNDVTHFSRRFKQEFGASPREFCRRQAPPA